jgi:hypothetical protein
MPLLKKLWKKEIKTHRLILILLVSCFIKNIYKAELK